MFLFPWRVWLAQDMSFFFSFSFSWMMANGNQFLFCLTIQIWIFIVPFTLEFDDSVSVNIPFKIYDFIVCSLLL